MKIKLVSDRMVANGTNTNIIISSVQLALHSVWSQSRFSALGAYSSLEEDVITQFLDLQHHFPANTLSQRKHKHSGWTEWSADGKRCRWSMLVKMLSEWRVNSVSGTLALTAEKAFSHTDNPYRSRKGHCLMATTSGSKDIFLVVPLSQPVILNQWCKDIFDFKQ